MAFQDRDPDRKHRSELTFNWRPCSAKYELLHRGTYLLDDVRPSVVFDDGTELEPGLHGDIEVRVELEQATVGGRDAVLVTMALSNHGRREVRVAAFTLFSARLPGRRALFRSGWQSWSFAGRWPAGRPDPDLVDDRSRPRHGHPRPGAPLDPPGPLVWSDWLTVLEGGPEGSPWLALSFVTGREQFGDIWTAPAGAESATLVRARSCADGRPVGPGETLLSETLAILAGDDDPWPVLEALAAETGRRAQAAGPVCPDRAGGSVTLPRRAAEVKVPTGWCTWYHHFDGISEEAVLADLARLAELGRGLPLEVFQIDDGYQAGVGDWLETNDRFPHGMKWLAARIREAGLKPGLWLAPFTVRPGTRVYEDHPDWVLRDEAGEPVPGGVNWGGTFYGLDVTHPEVEAHLRRIVRTVVRDWGYRYLKLDFLYCASLPGRRHDRRLTRAGALRRGLEVIRDEVPEAFILGCGCPLQPAVGLVDAMRIGPDVAPFWTPSPPLETDPSSPAALSSIRNVFARAFTHGRLWVNDPDCLLARDRETMLTADEVRTLATALACSGGTLVLSDRLADLSKERLDLVRRVLPPSGRAGRPVEPLGETLPSAVVVPPGERPPDAAGGRGRTDTARPAGPEDAPRVWTAAFFNWSDRPESGRRVDIPALLRGVGADLPPPEEDEDEHDRHAGAGGPKGELAWHVFDFWGRRYLGRFTEDVAVITLPEIPAHGSVVLALVQHRRNVPMVVGSDRHLVQGAPFVTGTADDGGRRLTVRVAPGGPAAVRVWVAVPVMFRLVGAEPGPGPVERVDGVWGQVLVFEVQTGVEGGRLILFFDRSAVTWVRPRE